MSASKFDAKTCGLILRSIRSGQTKIVAARTGGVTASCLEKWLKDPKKTDFQDDYFKAEAMAEEALVNIVQEHAQKDWKSAKWLLTRRFHHWKEESHTRQEVRDRLDELRIRKSEIEVEYAEMKLEVMKSADGDMDLLAVLNDSPQLEHQQKQPN
jgi:ATP-dependent protease HslVU (ClpYQ) ATPase subunit